MIVPRSVPIEGGIHMGTSVPNRVECTANIHDAQLFPTGLDVLDALKEILLI